jgi:transcriptional regulator with XRE-family HTH domain
MQLPQAGPLPALRRYLRLTQGRLAQLLGTTRLHLAHAETGSRPLPAAAETALNALLAALPPALAMALCTAPGHVPPPPAPVALAPPLPAPHAPTLLPRRLQAWLELTTAEAALATRQAQAAAGTARLALLASPTAPALGPHEVLFTLEAQGWTDEFAEAERQLLRARCEGLRHELALLGGPPPGAA